MAAITGLIAAFVAATFSASVAQEYGRAPLREDVYPILNEVVKEYATRQGAATVSIVRFTKVLEPSWCSLSDSDASSALREAFEDLWRNNTRPLLVEAKLDVPMKYELADSMETVGGARTAPPGRDPREYLREQIAKLERMRAEQYIQVQLSAPGVSQDRKTAVVYIAMSYTMEFIALRKTGSRWTIEQTRLCGLIS